MADSDWFSKVKGKTTQEVSDLVRSGNLTREETGDITQWQLNTLGDWGYMQAYPEVYGGEPAPKAGEKGFKGFGEHKLTPIMVILARLSAEINDYRSLKAQFKGSVGTHMRWLIDDKIRVLRNTRERMAGRDVFKSSMIEQEPPPSPSWMQEYLEPSMTIERPQYLDDEVRGRRRERREGQPKAAALRPMGAQAELGTEQMGLMASHLSWGKAGSPYKYSRGAIEEMADWEGQWQEQARLSESLFPKQAKLRANWRTALQR